MNLPIVKERKLLKRTCLNLILLMILIWIFEAVMSLCEKSINQNLFRMMVRHKNSLVQGISKINKINGVFLNLFKTNRVKSRRLKFSTECFFSCVCAAPSQLLEKHPGNSCCLQCVTWFMARNTGGRNHSLSERRKKCRWRTGEGGSLELWAPLSCSWLAACLLPALLSLEAWNQLLRGEIHLERAAPHPPAS